MGRGIGGTRQRGRRRRRRPWPWRRRAVAGASELSLARLTLGVRGGGAGDEVRSWAGPCTRAICFDFGLRSWCGEIKRSLITLIVLKKSLSIIKKKIVEPNEKTNWVPVFCGRHRLSHIRTYTHSYEHTHAHPTPMNTFEKLRPKTSSMGLKIEEVITCVSLSTGTLPPTGENFVLK
jgi:hypothetical protein